MNTIITTGGQITMKAAEKDKPIHTTPKGVWESSTTYKKEHKTQKEHLNEITTDAQGNGYPISNSTQEKE